MSIYVEIGELAQRTANMPTSTAYSFCGWFKSDVGASSLTDVRVLTLISTATEQVAFGWKNSEDIYVIANKSGGGSAINNSTSGLMPEGEWIFVTGRTTAAALTDVKIYAYNSSGTLIVENPGFVGGDGNIASFTATKMIFGGISAAFETASFQGLIVYFKTWDALLTKAELEAEQFSAGYVRTANANAGFVGDDVVITGNINGRDWTDVGSFLSVSGDGPTLDESVVAPTLFLVRGNRRLKPLR